MVGILLKSLVDETLQSLFFQSKYFLSELQDFYINQPPENKFLEYSNYIDPLV